MYEKMSQMINSAHIESNIFSSYTDIESSFFWFLFKICLFWLRVNWPYCWWRCSRVSSFSIYVTFSIIKDSYHNFDFNVFNRNEARKKENCGRGEWFRDLRRLNRRWHTSRSRWFCPSVLLYVINLSKISTKPNWENC